MSVKWYGPQITALVRRGMVKGLADAIGIVERRVIFQVMRLKKTGRKYRRRGGRYHQASAPYETFANDTGQTLARRTVKVDAAKLRATLTFHGKVPVYLEYGTRKMKPRPFARRALMATRQSQRNAILKAIAAELRGK